MVKDELDALLDSMDRPAAPVQPAYDQRGERRRQVRELRQLMSVFVKAGKTLSLYADDHRFFDRFTQEFSERIGRWFGSGRESLTLEITPSSILWDGDVVLDNPEQRENFAFKLYRDGVRLLQFRKGVTDDELRDFIHLIAREADAGTNQDLSVLFWEADFKHIQLAVAETFVAATDDARSLLQDLDERVARYERRFELTVLPDAVEDHVPEALPGEQDMFALEPDTNERNDEGTEYVPRLTQAAFSDEAVERVYEDLHGLEDPYATFEEVGSVLAEVVLAEDDLHELKLLLQRLDEALGPLLATAAVGPVNKLLRRLALISRHAEAQESFRAAPLREFFLHLAEPERLRLIGRAVDTDWREEGAGELFTFVSLQHPAAIPKLLTFLGQLHVPEARAVVVDALVLLAEREAKPFLDALNSGNARLMADGVRALGRIDDGGLVDRLLACISSPHAEVREAALTATRRHQSPRLTELALEHLGDEASAVRLAALRYCAVYKVRDALPVITNTIGKGDFDSRPFGERRGWYMTLGTIAGRGALSAFAKRLKRYEGTDSVDDTVKLLIYGIRATRHPEGKRLLNEFAKSARGDLRIVLAQTTKRG